MRASTIIAGLMATTAMAASPISRITSGMQSVAAQFRAADLPADIMLLNTDTVALDKETLGWDGVDVNNALKIQVASEKLAKDMKAVVAKIKAGPKISTKDATALQGVFQTFIPNAVKAVNDIITRKDKFAALSLTSVVYAQLTEQQKLAKAFNTEIYAKLPAIAHAEAKKQADAILVALDKGVKTFTED